MSDQQSPQAVECLPEKWQALCEAAPGWRSLYDKGLMMNEAAITSAGDAFSDAQATIDALRVELAIARGVMQNAMQCSNDLLAELATLKARALDVDASRPSTHETFHPHNLRKMIGMAWKPGPIHDKFMQYAAQWAREQG